jgi:hypothetical protein
MSLGFDCDQIAGRRTREVDLKQKLANMAKLVSLYVAGIVVLCILTFSGISALQLPGQKVSAEQAECVFAALQDQDTARQADKERFVRETEGMPWGQVKMLLSMRPQPPSAAEVEIARNQNLAHIEELCRLKLSERPG